MSWPIGYGKPDILYEVGHDGSVRASGIQVTDPDGWIEIPSPVSAMIRGAPATIAIRIRIATDAEGLPFLYAEDVQVGARYYNGIFELLSSEVRFGATRISEEIHGEIDRRIQEASSAPPVNRSGTMPRPSALGSSDLQDTWTETASTGTRKGSRR